MFARRNLSRSGGLTLTGIEQVVQSASDFWIANVHLSKIWSDDQILAYRALQAQNWGRAGEWIIPTCSQRGINTPAGGGSFSIDFSSDFDIGDTPGRMLPGSVTVAAPKGARSITVQLDAASTLFPQPGMYFSIGNRLYVIGTVSTVPGRYVLTFAPGLRSAASNGTVVDFSSTKCLMRLSQDNVGELNLENLRFADVSLTFVEIPT